ncbi:unnamed protein product [Gongylonema pulchrum]|uniref:Universal stress protein n=1 Tax=Gongylonema pulchrum TaxID=637853 RepID=A0A183E9S5_9BILA|nr:unnamed protein product [Gongylonema pulchrum]
MSVTISWIVPVDGLECRAVTDSLSSAKAANTVAVPVMRNIEAGARQNLDEISSSDRKAADDEMCEDLLLRHKYHVSGTAGEVVEQIRSPSLAYYVLVRFAHVGHRGPSAMVNG